MPIRFVDRRAHVGRIQQSLDGTSGLLQGTHVAPAWRTGVVTSQFGGVTASIIGGVTTSSNRTGVISSTLGGATALMQGSFGASGGVSIAGGLYTLSRAAGGFGVKTIAAPRRWENFAGATLDSLITSLQDFESPDPILVNGATLPKIKTGGYGGGKCAQMDYTTVPSGSGNFPKVGISGLAAIELYIACWARWEQPAVQGNAGIFKLCRAGAAPPYSGNPRFYETLRCFTSSGQIDSNDTGFTNAAGSTTWVPYLGARPPGNNFDRDGWHFLEYYYLLSSPAGAANGKFISKVDGSTHANFTANVTRESGTKLIDSVMTPFDGLDGNTTCAMRLKVSGIYIDCSPTIGQGAKHVVMTDNPVFANSTKFALQPAGSWADTNIQGTPNLDGFTSGTPGYFWVRNDLASTALYAGSAVLP